MVLCVTGCAYQLIVINVFLIHYILNNFENILIVFTI